MDKIYNYVLKNPKITSYFGNRTHPVTKKKSYHYGLDLVSNDKYIYAVEDGYVQKIVTGKDKSTTGYGNYIWVRYPRINRSLLHAHCSSILLKKGNVVKKGDKIAIMGSTGSSTGVHLHLGMTEIGKDKYLDPYNYKYVIDSSVVNEIDKLKQEVNKLNEEINKYKKIYDDVINKYNCVNDEFNILKENYDLLLTEYEIVKNNSLDIIFNYKCNKTTNYSIKLFDGEVLQIRK